MLTATSYGLSGKFLFFCILSVVLNMQGCHAQNRASCSCYCVLIPKQIEIPLYTEQMHDVLTYIIDDTIQENYFLIKILKIKDSYAYISAWKTRNDTVKRYGWIEIDNLGIYSNIYDGRLKLYSSPSINSPVKSELINPKYVPFQIKDCTFDGWLFVEYKDELNVIKSGWMALENQCTNPYTSCN